MTVHGDGHRRFELPGSMPHYGPDKKVDVLHIDLELRPDLARQRLDAVCTTTVAALDEAVSSLELDAVDLAVESVQCDKRPLSFVHRNKRLEIAFDPPIAPGKQASFAVAYHVVRPRHGLFFIAPSPEYPDRVPHAWTQSQDENARYWFPCFDHPGEKQTTSATVVVPRGQFALSNGALIERRDDGETTIFRYEQDVPHSTYLVTLVVGPFVERQQRGGERPIFFYVLPGREGDGERAFGATPKMMDVFEKRLGVTYPYSRYSQIAVSEFIFGGMENTSATTQTDRTLHDERAHLDFSSDSLVSHELAHQWFGDLLTTRDWSHAWLNEGFATFFEAVYREADLGYDEYLYDIFGQVARYLDEDASRYRRPIVYNHYRDPIELFDRHLYEKGGAVLHMLRGELGEARFWRSIRRYVADNAQRSVETIDLVRAIERATGRNTRAFFDQWVFRGGHPELKVTVEFDKDRKALSARIEQMQTVDDSHPAFAFSVELGVCPKPGEERRIRIRVERQLETLFLPMEEEPHLVRFDPGAFVLADVTYKFGARLAAAALQHDSDCVARIRAARELAKDGSRTARDALGRALAEESFWGVAAEIADA
ncbi:MAG: M1 family metallopeptidase, partial [Candidatus Eremiobacteraeota bacterium]|nr:M1 family metallopeptidase [Candidatus Eremiobacteraeota bacterium]